MHSIVTFIRHIANRYPHLGWRLADIVRRHPRLNAALARRYGIQIPPRPDSLGALPGYRLPLAIDRECLSARARRLLKQM